MSVVLSNVVVNAIITFKSCIAEWLDKFELRNILDFNFSFTTLQRNQNIKNMYGLQYFSYHTIS